MGEIPECMRTIVGSTSRKKVEQITLARFKIIQAIFDSIPPQKTDLSCELLNTENVSGPP